MSERFLTFSVGMAIVALLIGATGCQPGSDAKRVQDKAATHGHSDDTHDQDSAHGEHSAHASASTTAQLIRETGWGQPTPKSPMTLRFHVEEGGKQVKEFEVVHERPMHFIAVRDGLDEFLHLHPTVAKDGTAEVKIEFPAAGKYWLYLDVKPVGSTQQTIRQELQVAGTAAPPAELRVSSVETVEVDGVKSRISLDKKPEESVVTFQHFNLDGSPITNLEPYLGGMGHLVVIGAKTGEYVHAHPESETAPDGKVLFAVHFQKPGIYMAWGQFQREGRVFTVPVVLAVE